MPQSAKAARKLLELARHKGVLRVRDLASHGIHPETLRRLHERGFLVRAARGLYLPADLAPMENHSLAEACKRVPGGIVCLLSALRFHGLTTQLPSEVWLAVHRRAWRPRVEDLPLRIVRFSGSAFTTGVEEHEVEGVSVKVYSTAKTVADCFKYRNKIGLDVALEALRDCWKQRKASMDEITEAARVCRVANVMRPYLESLV
jgi:predicted transcriptional regulator of viral defense system